MKLYKIIRIIFGILIIPIGINMIFQFAEVPEMSPQATALLTAILDAGYMLPISGVIALITGISFVSNKYVPLTAVLFMPITLNLALFHIVLDPATGIAAYVFFLINLYIIWKNKEAYAMLTKA